MEYVTVSDKWLKSAIELCSYQSSEYPTKTSTLYFIEKRGFEFNFDLDIETMILTTECWIKDKEVTFNKDQVKFIINRLEKEYDDLHDDNEWSSENERLLNYLENSYFDTCKDESNGF